MSFASWTFVAFFALVLAGLRIMPTRASRQMLLLVSNVVFYGSGTPWHLLVLAIPSIVDYACAVRIEESLDDRSRRRWLTLSLVSNLGLLAYFKYADFFIDTVAALLGAPTIPLNIVLPIGISFFTFKTMSYTIDVYRRELPACRSAWRYAMFVSFFPELVAGPIVRASVFLPQLNRKLRPRWRRTAAGLQIALLGFSKKLLIADRLARYVDGVFGNPGAFSRATVISAIIAYSLQIYCDFSGYSDIAIGVARIVGFDLPENFDMPYVSTSITEFWRRWHITFSRWLRDYLYIPLGGNRRGTARTYFNVTITMLLGGLWHGARWTFVAWGLLHGLGLTAHKLWARRANRAPDTLPRGPLGRVSSWCATYAFVCVGWVLFRSPDFTIAETVFRKVVGLDAGGASWQYLPLFMMLPIIMTAHAIGLALRSRPLTPVESLSGRYLIFRRAGFMTAFVLTGCLLTLFLFAPLHLSPFIYFQF